MSEDDEPPMKRIKRIDPWVKLEKIDKCRNRYKEVLSRLNEAIDDEITRKPDSRVKELSEEILSLENKFKFPETKIGMIGSTGHGNSSLINAILDHKELLPTPGDKACTSVAIEVMENTLGTDFEAEIVFLKKQEWEEELNILVKYLKNLHGEKVNCSTDKGDVSRAKIEAVYGGDKQITSAEDLRQLTSPITANLGKVKTIKCASAEELNEKITIYVEASESYTSGQYWPIVKQVVLKLPNCNACSSGAILVDLPGIGDTNVARNKKLEEYMKTCQALWIASGIRRATDEQVAKNLLGDNFRHQLLLDGKYGTSDTLAFICTMTDDVYPSEMKRNLKLQNETREFQEKLRQAHDRKKGIEREFEADSAQQNRELREKMEEKQKLMVDRAEYLNLHPDPDSSNQKDYDDDQKSKKEHIVKLKKEITDLNAEKERQDAKSNMEIADYEKSIRAICALERNRDSKRVIQNHFKKGLMDLKRDRPDDENEETGDGDNLPVFCCSSVEYQKIKDPFTIDGQPKVFSLEEDTQIPDLREYVHTVMSRRKQYSAKILMESFKAITLRLKNSIFDENTTSCESFLTVIDDFDEKLKKGILENLSPQIDELFNDILYEKMTDGAKKAEIQAPETCTGWSRPVNSRKKTDRSSSGLDWRTYKSTVDRNGEYKSKTYNMVDFNWELSRPMILSFYRDWAKIFSDASKSKLLEIFTKMQNDFVTLLDKTMQKPFTDAEKDHNKQFMDAYSRFIDGLKERASWKSPYHQMSLYVNDDRQLEKLKDMVAQVKDTRMNKHQDIFRLIKPHIQSNLMEAYKKCSEESGTQMFERMKKHMSSAVETKCHTMFDDAARRVKKELDKLKKSIMELVESSCTSLVREFRNNFKQLLKNESQFTAEFVQTIKWVDEEVNRIEADMECLEENIPAASSAQH